MAFRLPGPVGQAVPPTSDAGSGGVPPPGGRDTVQDSRPQPPGAAPRPPERLRRREDFQNALRRGRRFRHPLLHLVAYRTDREDTRIGFSVSTRVGGAVVRNRIKRRLRMIVRAIPWHPGLDLVLLVQPAGASASFQELEAAIADTATRMQLTAGVDE